MFLSVSTVNFPLRRTQAESGGRMIACQEAQVREVLSNIFKTHLWSRSQTSPYGADSWHDLDMTRVQRDHGSVCLALRSSNMMHSTSPSDGLIPVHYPPAFVVQVEPPAKYPNSWHQGDGGT